MKALVFGTTGQVAIELRRNAPLVGMEIAALGRAEADLTDPAACAAHVKATDADIVINAAAYTAVDAAETDREAAERANADAPGAMARAAAARGLPFLHISTDYVFDGAGARPLGRRRPGCPPWRLWRDKTRRRTAGHGGGGPHAILRTPGSFRRTRKNFVKTMLRLGAERDALSVVDDQRGGPTAAHEIAKALIAIGLSFHEGRGTSGIFHFAGQPACSWADFAEAIFAASALPKKPVITRIPTSAYRCLRVGRQIPC